MKPNQFRSARIDAGLTQPSLADLLGISKRAVQYYEAGERAIPQPVIRLFETILKGKRCIPKNSKPSGINTRKTNVAKAMHSKVSTAL